jgi:hypothetical protein
MTVYSVLLYYIVYIIFSAYLYRIIMFIVAYIYFVPVYRDRVTRLELPKNGTYKWLDQWEHATLYIYVEAPTRLRVPRKSASPCIVNL